MLHLLTFCLLLATAAAQSGYEYNKPGKPFTPSSQPNQPSTGFPNSSKAPGNQYQDNGSTAGYPSGPSYTSSGPTGYPSASTPSNPLGYPNLNKPSGPSDYPGSNTPSAPSGYPGTNTPASGSSGYPGANLPSAPSDYPGANKPSRPSSYPGANTPSRPSTYPKPNPSGSSYYPGSGTSDTPNNQGTNKPTRPTGYPGSNQQRPPSGFLDQGYQGQGNQGNGNGQQEQIRPGQNYPGQGQNYPNQGTNQGSQGTSGFGTPGQSNSGDDGTYEGGDYSAIPGEPDKDYPILTEIPQTSFSCDAQAYPGYYADVETRCQVFHVCANNRTYDFLCPNGTIFSQEVFVCVWWNQFDCNTAPNFFELNANLYDQSSTLSGAPFAQTSGNNVNYSGQQGPTYSDVPGSQGSASYPGNSGQQKPSGNYPGSAGQQRPSIGFPGTGSNNYPETGSSSLNPGNSDTQSSNRPSGSGSPDYQGISYPQSVPKPHLDGPHPSYPGSGSTSSSSGGNKKPGYPNVSDEGYPSGRPTGPNFDTGSQNKPGSGFQQTPNREYLPPRN